MKTSRSRLREIALDLMGGAHDEEIRRRYSVSQELLAKIKHMLALKSVSHPEKPQSEEASSSTKKRRHIDATQFLLSFRENSDDFHLMKHYALKPKQLRRVYETLIGKGLLSEYEYHCRQVKASELEEPTENHRSDSTLVCLLEDVSDDTRRLYSSKKGASGPVSSPDTRRHSGRVQETRSAHAVSLDSRAKCDSSGADNGACPKCAKPKISFSSETCAYCGVVFSKVAGTPYPPGVAIWDMDFYER